MKPTSTNNEFHYLLDIFENAPAFMALYTGENLIFERANKAFFKIIGNRQLIGKPIDQALPELKNQPFINLIKNVYKTGKPFYGNEMRAFIKKSPTSEPEEIYVNVVYQPVHNEQKEIVGVFSHSIDVTDQVKTRLQFENLVQQQVQEHYRTSFAQQAGKIGTFEWDLREIQRSYWSKEFELLYGYPNGGFDSDSKDKWVQHVHPDDKKRVKEEIENYLADKKSTEMNIEFKVKWPDNSLHYLVTRAQIIRNTKGKAQRVIGVNIDITERKTIENNLVFLSQVSKVLSSSLDYKKTLKNIATLSVTEMADWCTIHMQTDTGIEQLAVAHSDPKKVKWALKFHEKKSLNPQEKIGIAKVMRTGKPEYYPVITDEMLIASAKDKANLELLRKVGFSSVMMMPIIVEDKTVGVISFIASESRKHYTLADLIVAEEVASRAALAIENSRLYHSAQENESRYRSFVDSNIVGVFTANKEGYIIDCNTAFEKITGYTKKEILKKNLTRWEITPQEYTEEVQKAMEELKKYGRSNPWEKEYIKKDGSQVPVIVASTLINEERGENITIVLDITERKRLEQRKDEFIGIASHELKTPLTSIKGYTQILERIIKQMSDDRLKLYLKKTNIYINRLDSLITDLLDVSRIQAGKLQFNMSNFDVYTLVNESIEAIQPTAEHHKIICEKCIHAQIYGDMPRLEQVILNMLSNAIKYSPESKKVNVSVQKKDNKIMVSVQDFGIGIPKKSQSKLFERFYRVEKTASQFSGLGIGLYISAEIVFRHGGDMWVESEEGKGSTFFFTLPIRGKK